MPWSLHSEGGLSRAILVPILALMVVSFAAAVGVLVYVAGVLDDREERHAVRFVTTQLGDQVRNVRQALADYANWGTAYRYLHVQFDRRWAFDEDNVGAALHEYFGFDYVLLLDPQGREIYGVEAETLAASALAPRFGNTLPPLVDDARKPDGTANGAVVGFGMVGKDPVLIAAAPIRTGGDPLVVPIPGPPSVLVFAKRLDPATLAKMGQSVFIHGFRVAADAADAAGAPRHVERTTSGGDIVFRWDPEQPGRALLRLVLPALSLGGVVLMVVLAALVRHGRSAEAAKVAADAELAAVRARAEHLASHDPVTGLPTRARLTEAVDRLLAEGTRKLAVLYVDLDRFKGVNERFGHAIGDEVLRVIAGRLLEVASGRLVARAGGDEFVVVLRDASSEDVEKACEHLLRAAAAAVTVGTDTVEVGASIGVALAPGDALDTAGLLRAAEIALRQAKASGRSTYRFHSADMNARVLHRLALESDLRDAVRTEGFELHFQPRVDAWTLETNSLEALIRWHHPKLGYVGPQHFIPLAEDTGLIAPIGEWVLKEACRAAIRLGTTISVNVSPIQFRRDGFPDLVAAVLKETGLPADRLELEITEGVLMDDAARVIATFTALKRLGVALSMDDFGTGFSSLGYLRSYPFDIIKIDASFVRDLPGSAGARAIVQAVLGLGRALGMRVVAEGVETREQLQILKTDGCDEVQGFFTGRPVPEAEIALRSAATTEPRVASAGR